MKKILLVLSIVFAINSNAQIITTIAGTGVASYSGDGGSATAATVNGVHQLYVDTNGNLYITDLGNYCIRKVSAVGIITTVAGDGTGGYSGDGGPATAAQLYQPRHVTFDTAGNMYIADSWNNAVRMVNNSGIISTIAGTGTAGFSGDGGPATSAMLDTPFSIAVDKTGNVYIADRGNNRIRKINTSGIISTFAGTGTAGFGGDGGLATAAQFTNIASIALDTAGNLFVADDGNNRIRMINTSGIINTIAGIGTNGYTGDGGPAASAELDGIDEIVFDIVGNLFLVDEYNQVIRKINTSGIISTVAGNNTQGFSGDGGPALSAQLNFPRGVAVDAVGNIYISEWGDDRIRFVCAAADTVSGLITEPNSNPVNAGQVYVYRQNLTHAGLLDTAGFAPINANGTYAFSDLPHGNYFIQAVAAASYTNAVSTYYSNKTNNYRWDSAIFVTHNGCVNSHFTGYDITIVETPAQTGTGVISGTVSAIAGYGQRPSAGNNAIQGAPLKGVGIKLGKNPGGCAARTTTDPVGTYTFTGIDTGSYYVYVDIPNFPMDTILSVHLTTGNPSSTNNDYCVDSAMVQLCSFTTGINHSAVGSKQFLVYPNPANNTITVQSLEELGSIIIYNSLGEIVLRVKSRNTFEQIDLSKLNSGIYMIQAQGRYLKLVKE